MNMVICHNRYGEKFEVSEDEIRFRPAVYAVIIKDGKILLSKQWDGYDFPGGGIEIGERIYEALKREVREETGLEIGIGKLIDCTDSFFRSLEGNNWHSLLIYYLCEIVEGDLSIANADQNEQKYISLPEWIGIDDLEKIKFYNSIDSLEIIKKALSKIHE